jgi:ketosteroid isomerase-like protein
MDPVTQSIGAINIVDRDNETGKPSGLNPLQDSESVAAPIGPHNPALGEIYQRLYPEMRRPKPNQEAIAAALQAMQRLTMETDSEAVAERESAGSSVDAQTACSVCGHHNRSGNKFCGACGILLGTEPPEPANLASQPVPPPNFEDESSRQAPEAAREVHPPSGSSGGAHYYHHHYHHHYFQGGQGEVAPAARANAPESAREADRLRIAAAAKGEPMSRSEAAVRRLTQEWVLACNTRQLDELIELYAADALVLRSNLPPIRGAMAVREFFFASLEAGLGEVALDPLRVEVSGDLAHEVGRYSALVPGTAGQRREERGKYLWVFAKQSSGDWKLLSECWSSDLILSGTEADIAKSVIPSGSKAQPRRN